ncbi:MAG: hypothetical protein ACFFDW_08115 [Candidatus Thorarchaeota archaeon]
MSEINSIQEKNYSRFIPIIIILAIIAIIDFIYFKDYGEIMYFAIVAEGEVNTGFAVLCVVSMASLLLIGSAFIIMLTYNIQKNPKQSLYKTILIMTIVCVAIFLFQIIISLLIYVDIG